MKQISAIRDATSLRGIVAARGLADTLAGVVWVARHRRVVPRPVEAARRRLEGPPCRTSSC